MSTTTPSHSGERRKSRKGLIGITAIGVAGVLVAGLGFAYFSDSLTFGGSATAGSLDLTGTPEVTVNATTVVSAVDSNGLFTVPNLNPGDVIRMNAPLTNAGNKSAWIRTHITGTAGSNIADDLYVFSGEHVPAQSDLLGEDLTADDGPLLDTFADSYLGTVAALSTAYNSAPEVINGTAGPDTEVESSASSTEVSGQYSANVVVYFDSASTNQDQGQALTLDAVVQAVQYRNNPTPTWDGFTFEMGSYTTGDGWEADA